MTNLEIYNYAQAISEAFKDSTQYLPVKVNFYIQKNKNTLLSLAQDIEAQRTNIIKNYGQPSEENPDQYIIPADNLEKAQQELMDLFSIEQDVPVFKINVDLLPEDISLTTGQMEAIMFMFD